MPVRNIRPLGSIASFGNLLGIDVGFCANPSALDNAAHGIRVNCVCPTWVETPMIQSARDGGVEIDSWVKGMVPLGRIATAEEVADAVIFFCSPRSSYATGCGFILDGGTTLTCHV